MDVPKDSNRKCDFEVALDLTGFGKYNIAMLSSCCFLILAMYLDIFGFSVVLPAAACDLGLSTSQQGLLSAVPLIGVMVSSYAWGLCADTCGRRWTLLLAMPVGAVLNLAASMAPGYASLAVLKFLSAGFTSSANAAAFVLVGETTPARHRSRFMFLMASATMLVQFIICVFAIPVFGLTFRYSISWLSLDYRPWRLLMQIIAVPGIIGCLGMLVLLESPKFLLSKDRDAEALEVLKNMHEWNEAGKKFTVDVVYLEESLHATNLNVSFLRRMWDQTAPLFKPPLLKNNLKLYYILLCAYMTIQWTTNFVAEFDTPTSPEPQPEQSRAAAGAVPSRSRSSPEPQPEQSRAAAGAVPSRSRSSPEPQPEQSRAAAGAVPSRSRSSLEPQPEQSQAAAGAVPSRSRSSPEPQPEQSRAAAGAVLSRSRSSRKPQPEQSRAAAGAVPSRSRSSREPQPEQSRAAAGAVLSRSRSSRKPQPEQSRAAAGAVTSRSRSSREPQLEQSRAAAGAVPSRSRSSPEPQPEQSRAAQPAQPPSPVPQLLGQASVRQPQPATIKGFWSTGYTMWVPTMMNAYFNGEDSAGLAFCEVASGTAESTNSTSTDCDNVIQSLTLYAVMCYSGASGTLTVLLSFVVGPLGKKKTTVLVFVISATAGVALLFVKIPLLSIALFYIFLYVALILGNVNTYLVELNPTYLRGMATCLSVVVARGFGFFSVQLIAQLLADHCTPMISGYVVLVASGLIIAFFLPPDISKKGNVIEKNLDEEKTKF